MLYVYHCDKCGAKTEQIRKIAEADEERRCPYPVGTTFGLGLGGHRKEGKGFYISHVAILPNGEQADPHATIDLATRCTGKLIRDVIQDLAHTPYAWKP